MQISRNEFTALCAIKKHSGLTQRELAELTGLSLGTINGVSKSLATKGLVEDGRITAKGASLSSHIESTMRSCWLRMRTAGIICLPRAYVGQFATRIHAINENDKDSRSILSRFKRLCATCTG